MTNPLDGNGVALEPCPFCGDPMQVSAGTLRHVDQGTCPVGAYAWGSPDAVARWNRRSPAPSHTAVEPVAELVELLEAIADWLAKSPYVNQYARSKTVADAASTLTAQAAALVAAERERDEARTSMAEAYERAGKWQARAEAAESEVATLKARVAELEADTSRLDFLDDLNAQLNAASGTVYRWEMVINHNVNRLMMNFPRGVDLNDAKAHGFPSCREAIDREMCRIIASRRARRLTHQEEEQWPVG